MSNSTMEVKEPESVITEEIDLLTVRVNLSIPGLHVKKSFMPFTKQKPHNAKVSVKFEERRLEVDVIIEKKNVNYQFKIKKLPGAIIDCAEQYEKDKIILTLTKKAEESWVASLDDGLETDI
ncbi:uncharacterized protein LOC106881860 [Octopus bimaculoides]|uniref:CS domain-containing protein n=1 Tax=Octopus bimaculoides TaxID=37653 RepID=A0A0L8FQ76_OCTBM|nr:uncharacterized protein LOC106881860 [Octopus bimaculoides]|eukprot:XP_014787864.1 PREDICTED: uncharacterized protein LOC106881860 [Octopus bimaculoides]